MRKQVARSLQNRFVAAMARRLPLFSPITQSWDVLSLEVSSELYFFVHLSIDDDRDSFTLEIACNTANRFPWTELPGQLRDLSTASRKNLWRFRISKLWGEVKDFRWHLGQAKLADLKVIEDLIEDAVERVCRYAIPYFEEVAKNQGCQLHIERETS